MANIVNIDSEILSYIADGKFHSGRVLGDKLGVSRAAVHNHIEKLSDLGLDIFRVAGKGYRLAQPLDLLDASKIRESLGKKHQQLPFIVNSITGSTNDDLKRHLAEQGSLEAGTAVLSEMQTQGRGRRGKQWYSPFGTNLYMSMYWPLYQGLNAAIGMSVAVGFRLAKMLERAGISDVSVKWPNDIYIERKKVAGILVELEGHSVDEGHALIGVGLNLNMTSDAPTIEQPYTSVTRHLGHTADRNLWSGELLRTCFEALKEHDSEGLANITEPWKHIDHFYGQRVCLHMGKHQQSGVAKGIDELGALLLEQEGKVKRYFGGEVSVRASD